MDWISVNEKEKLPKAFDQEVLFTDGKEIYKGYRMESDEEISTWFTEFYIENVTHWMQLPSLPSKDKS